MKESYRQRLHDLAKYNVTEERFKPHNPPQAGVGQTVIRLAQMPHLPDNVFLLERESNYRLDEPPEAA